MSPQTASKWRHFIELSLVFLVIVAEVFYLQLIANSHFTAGTSLLLRSRAQNFYDYNPREARAVKDRIRLKAEKYITMIEDRFLDEGMVINRNVQGEAIDLCDSLLFSSLYFSALTKLGYEAVAAQRWASIEQSTSPDGWLRHPKCPLPPPSRDMIMGLLISLSQKPAHYHAHLRHIFNRIYVNGGYFATGSMFVSYLSPGMAEMMRKFARIEGLSYAEIPDEIRRGFSTIEWSVGFVKSGFASHLHALNTWLELELTRQIGAHHNAPIRSLTEGFDPVLVSLSPASVAEQRLEWVTQKLVEKDPQNLFFRYLRYRAAKALNAKVIAEMLRELAAMSQFPDDRLPNDCDRRADYLWQRDSSEYVAISQTCHRLFPGVDFLWMAALLLTDGEDTLVE